MATQHQTLQALDNLKQRRALQNAMIALWLWSRTTFCAKNADVSSHYRPQINKPVTTNKAYSLGCVSRCFPLQFPENRVFSYLALKLGLAGSITLITACVAANARSEMDSIKMCVLFEIRLASLVAPLQRMRSKCGRSSGSHPYLLSVRNWNRSLHFGPNNQR